MNFVLNFPLFCIVGCLAASVISSILRSDGARRLTLGLLGCVAAMNAAVLAYILQAGQPFTYMMGHFPHPWGNELYFGILEPLFSMFFAIIMILCILGGLKHLKADLEYGKRRFYYVMVDLVMAALLVLCYTGDLFTGYVFIEICTLAACGLLMIRNVGRTTLASVRYMIFSLIGSGLFLLGVIILYDITGHLLMPNIRQAVTEIARAGSYRVPLGASICLITAGLAIKSGLFPFHFWMPDTYGYATPCSSGILSGLISKGYILFLLKIIFQVFGTEVFYGSGMQNVLFVFGVCGMTFGSLGAIAENDIFRMTAYSSAAQIGYIYMGIGLSPTAGVLAALMHVLTHGATKPALFLSVSEIVDTAGGKRQFKFLQGMGRANPMAALGFSFGAFSMIGIPLTMGFMSKFLFAMAGMENRVKLIPTLMALALSTVLNTFYFARTVIRLWNEPKGALPPKVSLRDRRLYAGTALVFIVLNLAAGIFASPLISLLEQGLALFGKVG